MFAKDVYVRRRQTLIDSMKAQGASGIALFIGNVDSPAQYRDNCYKFRQDSSWLYYFGIDEPRYAAILDLDSGAETLYADDVEIDDIIWMGPMPSVASVAAGVGVCSSAPYGALDDAVANARSLGRKVHFLPASRYYNAMKLGSLLGLDPYETFSKGKSGCPAASAEMVRAVVGMRLVKEDIEIAELDHACMLGQQMHTIARKGIVVGVKEQEIVGAMEALTLAKGWGVSFATILTQHGEIFHCHSHENPIEPGKLLVIDAGLETNDHYASDFTRTYPTGGKFTPMQRDIYQLVYECNEHAFDITRPGIAYLDVHLSVAHKMLQGLKDLHLVHGDVDGMVEAGIAGLFMPHGLGHNMVPDLIRQWKREGTDKGFVDYDKLEAYFDFGGIRLEDDVLITPEGARRLGADRLPIAPDDVEAAMAADKA